MKILKDTPCIFIRLIDYKNNDFAKEHYNVFMKNKKVWLLKMGKTVKEEFIKTVIEKKGVLITKSTARNGNQFYICKIEKINELEDYIYPDYYKELFKEMSIDKDSIKSCGYWFKITDMKKVEHSLIDKFETISTHRSLLECGTKFNQVSQMHVVPNTDIQL